MRLSTNLQYHNAKAASGFEVAPFDTLGELKNIVSYDHAPAIFDKGIRSGANVISCDCLILEVDNVDGLEITIEDFQSLYFPSLKYWITTSRNHQKPKETGGAVSPPVDRYHVIFPLLNPVAKSEYEYLAKMLTAEFKFFDSAVTDASRFYFGNKEVEIFFHDGEIIELPAQEIEEVAKPAVGEWEYDCTISTDTDKRSIVFSSLLLAKNADAFHDYRDWIRIGMALKADGWGFQDWVDISESTINLHEAQYKWSTFPESGKISGATVLYYARMGNPDCLVPGRKNQLRLSALGSTVTDKEVATAIKEVALISARPTKLTHAPNQAIINKIKKEITDKEGNIIDEWYYLVLKVDAEIANCLHYDYTIGEIQYEYYNTRQLKTAVLGRLRYYAPLRKITDQVIDRIVEKIEEINNGHNRVLETMDSMVSLHPHDTEKEFGWELDTFLKIFEWACPVEAPYHNDDLNKYYKEVWHLFFLRMHMHIEGTRITENGYKLLLPNDIVPVLSGDQDQGKTTLCEWIALKHISPSYYADLGSGDKGGSQFGSMNTARQCRGRILAELGEMKLMKKSDDVETVKSFISKTQYDIDVKYVESSNPVPVTVSFAGTSNDLEYLSDPTGNRRWWPIWIKTINKEWLGNNRDHIEKLHAFYARLVRNMKVELWFKSLEVSDGLKRFMEVSRKKSMIRYSDYDAIIQVVSDDYIEKSHNKNYTKKYHTIAKYEIEKLMYIAGYHMRVGDSAVRGALEEMGYKKDKVSINGHTRNGWKKEFIDNDTAY